MNEENATFKDYQGMKYLECVINETMRLFPVLPFLFRQVDEDVSLPSTYIFSKNKYNLIRCYANNVSKCNNICILLLLILIHCCFCEGGYKLPAGSFVNFFTFNIHRNERFFFEPEKFIPERFLNENSNRPRFSYMPFGGGVRTCIGTGSNKIT